MEYVITHMTQINPTRKDDLDPAASSGTDLSYIKQVRILTVIQRYRGSRLRDLSYDNLRGVRASITLQQTS